MADEKRWFEKRAPEMAKGWGDFYNAVEGETALDKKTKALIASRSLPTLLGIPYKEGHCPGDK